MAYVAFSVSRQGAISENGGKFCHSVNGRSVATTPSHRYVDGTKGLVLIRDKAGD